MANKKTTQEPADSSEKKSWLIIFLPNRKEEDKKIERPRRKKRSLGAAERREPQQGNIFQRMGRGIGRFVQETIGELRKVSWPTRREALNLTWIVLLVIGVMTVYLGVILDTLYSWFFRVLLGA